MVTSRLNTGQLPESGLATAVDAFHRFYIKVIIGRHPTEGYLDPAYLDAVVQNASTGNTEWGDD